MQPHIDFDDIRERVSIVDVLNHFGIYIDKRNWCICPCHKDTHPSGKINLKGNYANTMKCYVCGAFLDPVGIVREVKGLSVTQAIQYINNNINRNSIPLTDKPIHRLPKKEIVVTDEQKENIAKYVKSTIKHIDKTDYFIKRGLSKQTIKYFCLGYDAYDGMVVIPYSSKLDYYQKRSISGKHFFKPKIKDAGREPIYFANVIYNKKSRPIFVVESPICAMSIYQCGGLALALCGTATINKLEKKLEETPTSNVFILCLDNDSAGEITSISLSRKLDSLNIKHIIYNIAEELKDPNDMLIHDPEKLKQNIELAESIAKRLDLGYNRVV